LGEEAPREGSQEQQLISDGGAGGFACLSH
jgi:hypothetical protein